METETKKSLNLDLPDLHDDHDLKKSGQSIHPKNQGEDKWEIPGDWEIRRLGDCCLLKGEYGINAPAFEFSEDLPAYLRITDIDDNGNYSKDKKASVGDPNYKQYVLRNGDIVFARTGATVGKTYLYKPTDGLLVFAGFLIRFRTNDKFLIPQYLKYFTETKHYWDWVKTVSMRSGQPGINAEEYASLKIPLPPLPEQHAIARVLSTADAVIHTTEKLIAQKELRKKWLMQQLLTGKKRLKGFEGEWREMRMDELFSHLRDTNDGFDGHSIMTISAKRGLISQEDKFDRVIAGDSLRKYTQLINGDFAYNKGNSKTYPMGCIYRLERNETALVPFVYICFRPTSMVDGDFYKHYFLAHRLDAQLNKIITSGARGDGLLNVSSEDFFKVKVPYPKKEEQTAIAQVLQAADKEISLLKAKAEKLREQKKGLMQVLLTGEKRLNLDSRDLGIEGLDREKLGSDEIK